MFEKQKRLDLIKKKQGVKYGFVYIINMLPCCAGK